MLCCAGGCHQYLRACVVGRPTSQSCQKTDKGPFDRSSGDSGAPRVPASLCLPLQDQFSLTAQNRKRYIAGSPTNSDFHIWAVLRISILEVGQDGDSFRSNSAHEGGYCHTSSWRVAVLWQEFNSCHNTAAKLRVDHALELETLKFGSVLYETCCTKLQADNHVCKLTIAGDIAAWL